MHIYPWNVQGLLDNLVSPVGEIDRNNHVKTKVMFPLLNTTRGMFSFKA